MYNQLAAVPCSSCISCTAVGDYGDNVTNQTLVESWNGMQWSIVSSPSPAGYSDNLNGVSCISGGSCVAVGSSFVTNSSAFGPTLVESWDGTSWSLVTSSSPGSQYNTLRAASCIPNQACVATGIYGQGSTQQTLIESGEI